MKIGDLASILNKDALELAKAYDLAEKDDELGVDTLKNVITSEIKNIEKNSLKAGKDNGYGMAERLVKGQVEKQLKTAFDIEGTNLDELIDTLSQKMTAAKTKPKETDDKELLREKELRQKIEDDFKAFKENVEKEKQKAVQFSTFDTHFAKKFDISQSWIKAAAFEKFMSKYEIQKGSDSVFAVDKQTGKPISDSLDDLINNFFKDDFDSKTDNKANPGLPSQDEVMSISGTKEELFEQLRKEKDPVRIQAITKKLKEMK